MSLEKCKRDREEDNIVDTIADERSYEDRGKIMQVIHGDYRDGFIVEELEELSLDGSTLQRGPKSCNFPS